MEGDRIMMLPFLKARIGGADIDMMPNPFAFTTQNGAAPNTLYASNIVQVTGISVPVPVTVSAGQFRVLADAAGTQVVQDWGTFGSIKKGQYIQARLTSSNTYGATVSMSVTVGKYSALFYIVTAAVTGGSGGWGSPGTFYFTIPYHNSFNFDVYGAGGGGGGCGGVVPVQNYYSGGPGGTGGYSQIYDEETGGGKVNVIGWAGGGGSGMQYAGTTWNYANGGAGSAQGGDGNIPGGGAGGGASSVLYPDYAPDYRFYGGNGGPGGRAYRSVGRGLLTPGTRLVILVGQGGAPGADSPDQGYIRQSGGWGGNGASYISWG
jgi:hypothetical protein